MFPPPKAAAAPVADDSPNGPTPAVGAALQSLPLGMVAPPRSLGDIDNVPSPLKIAPVPTVTTLAALGQPPPRSVGEGLNPPTNKSVAPSGTPAPSRAAAAAFAPGGGGADVSPIAVRLEPFIALPVEGAGTCAKPVLLKSRIAAGRIAAAMINRPISTSSRLRMGAPLACLNSRYVAARLAALQSCAVSTGIAQMQLRAGCALLRRTNIRPTAAGESIERPSCALMC
jgi:hypothetical protein